MSTTSPSGALSPYYYKGGYFHGIHFGNYRDDAEAFRDMMAREEAFILSSSERRRILVDLYDTDLPVDVLADFVEHIERLRPRIVKLAVSADRRTLNRIRRALFRGCHLGRGQMCFTPDMEEGKTWLVSDGFS